MTEPLIEKGHFKKTIAQVVLPPFFLLVLLTFLLLWQVNRLLGSARQTEHLDQLKILLFGALIFTAFFGVIFFLIALKQFKALADSYQTAVLALRRSHSELETRVSERTQALKDANSELELFRLLALNIKDYAILILDPDGIVISWSHGAERIKGYKSEEIIGKHFSIFYTKEDQSTGHPEKELQEALVTGHYEEEGVRIRKDGSQFFANVLITPLFDESNNLRGFAKITRDITELKRDHDALQRANKELEKKAADLSSANQELEAFSYSVSHDLRAPLRGIDGFSQALIEDYSENLDGTAQDYLKRIRAGVQKMGRLIDDLLNLSRLTRTTIQHKPVNLSDLAQQIVQDLQSHDPDRRVSVTISNDLSVLGDPGLLSAVLQNLFSNAWKFTSKSNEQRIEFGQVLMQETKVYYIKDTGVGFDMAYSDRLFAAFQRLHHVRDYPGTGIGLATVRRIIRRHNGEIWVESKVGVGTTFFFTIGSRVEKDTHKTAA